MEVILPFKEPIIETFQCTSFVLSVTLAHENIANEYYNKYIQVYCNDTENIHEVNTDYEESTWNYYHAVGLATKDMYYIRNFEKEQCGNFIKERLNQDEYILLMKVNEYHLSYSTKYQSQYFVHDTYIYGYDDTDFYVMAYINNKMTTIKIPQHEILDALYSEIIKDNFILTYRVNKATNVEIDIDQIYIELLRYYSSIGPYENRIYGLATYDTMERCIKALANPEYDECTDIDLRSFRTLWEHKKIYADRLTAINNIFPLPEELFNMHKELEQISSTLFYILIKYDVKKKVKFLEKSIPYIHELKEKDRKFVKALLVAISNYRDKLKAPF